MKSMLRKVRLGLGYLFSAQHSEGLVVHPKGLEFLHWIYAELWNGIAL
jgi:hypothetical protein